VRGLMWSSDSHYCATPVIRDSPQGLRLGYNIIAISPPHTFDSIRTSLSLELIDACRLRGKDAWDTFPSGHGRDCGHF